MTKLLALTALSALLVACARPDHPTTGAAYGAGGQDERAAFLGYHGPVERSMAWYGN